MTKTFSKAKTRIAIYKNPMIFHLKGYSPDIVYYWRELYLALKHNPKLDTGDWYKISLTSIKYLIKLLKGRINRKSKPDIIFPNI